MYNIFIKELKNNIVSLRFLMTVILTIVIMVISSIIFITEYSQRMRDYREVENENNELLSGSAENLSSLARAGQRIQMPPTPMAVIAEGGLKNIPKRFELSAFELNEPEYASRENKFLGDLTNVDWIFIISIILSFFALLLTYDAVNGEKTDGTLGLLMSNSVSRNSVMAAKFLSALTSITIPLLLGMVLSLSIVVVYGKIALVSSQLFGILIIILASFVYLAIFVLIGLLVSSLTTNPVTSIIVSLFIWVTLTILLPSSGGTVASGLYSIPPHETIRDRIAARRGEIGEEHRARYERVFRWNGDPWAEWVPYRCAAVNEMDAAEVTMENEYMYQRLSQVKKTRKLLVLSPTVAFNSMAEQICITGIEGFEYYYSQLTEYERLFRQFIEAKDREDSDSPHCVYSWEASPMSQKPVSFDEIPRFQLQPMSFSGILQVTLFNSGVLLLFTAAFFILVFYAFARYDVR